MNPKSRRPAVASPSSAHTDRSDQIQANEILLASCPAIPNVPISKYPGPGEETHVAPAELLAEHHHSENGARQKLDVFTPTA